MALARLLSLQGMYRRASGSARLALAVFVILAALLGVVRPLPAQVATPRVTGSVEGTVSDAASGERRPSVTVVLLGTTRGAVTDDAGRFEIANVPAGTYMLRARQIGYSPVELPVVVRAGAAATVNIRLQSVPVLLGAVSASARSPERERFELQTGVGHIQITPSSVSAVPSLGEPDVLRTVQLMPGVNARNDFSSGYNVRGGESDQNLILLDGYPIYNPFHLGGLFSTFLDETVGSIDLLTGGFGAAFGSRLSSVLDVTSAEPVRTGLHGSSAVSVISSSLAIGSASADGRSSWTLAGRRTYADKLVAAISDQTFPYHFSDGQLHATRALGKGNAQVSLTAYTGTDQLLGDFAEVGDSAAAGGGLFTFGWTNELVGLTLSNGWNERPRVPLLGVVDSAGFVQKVSLTRFATGLDLGSGAFSLTNSVHEFRLSGSAGAKKGTHSHQAGYDASTYAVHYDVRSAGSKATLFSLEQHVVSSALYYQDEWKPSRRLIVDAGLRLEHLSSRDWTGLSPRIAAKWFVNRDLALSVAAGKYAQWMHSLNREDIPVRIFDFWVASDQYAEISRAEHLVVGMEKWMGPLRFARVEGWYKRYDHLLEQNSADDPGRRGDEFLDSNGDSYGVDLLLRQVEMGKFAGWLAYTYGVSVRRRGEESYWPGHDRRHNLNLVGTWKPGERYTFSARLGLSTGTPYTDIVGEVVRRTYDPGRNVYTTSQFETTEPVGGVHNGSRYPFFQRLDIGLSRTGAWHGLQLMPYASILNAYNAKNVFIYTFNYRRRPPTRNTVGQFPLLPTLGLTVGF